MYLTLTSRRWLSVNVRELRPNIRYDPTNHCPGWPHHVTGMVDSFPIYCYSSKDPVLKWGLYSGKYKRSAIKFEVAFDFLGLPLLSPARQHTLLLRSTPSQAL